MIKYLFKKANLGFLGLVIGMALIGIPNEAKAGGCCATDSPGAACGGCCQNKWKLPTQTKQLQDCHANCKKGNCSSCCATDSPGAACSGCCENKWKGPSKAKNLEECQENCKKGNCKRTGVGTNKNK